MKKIFTILACIFTAAVFMPAAVFADGNLQVPPANALDRLHSGGSRGGNNPGSDKAKRKE